MINEAAIDLRSIKYGVNQLSHNTYHNPAELILV